MVLEQIPVVLAFVLAGIAWSAGGYLSAWRNHLKDKTAEWKGFEVPKLKDDVILGVILGIAAFFVNAYDGATLDVTSLQAFGVVFVTATGVVSLVDKYIVAGLFGK